MRSKYLDDIVARQIHFSRNAFGPGPRTKGLLQHINKETTEILDDPMDVLEWVDVMILAMDGAWRALKEQHPWMEDGAMAKQVSDALQYKMEKNLGRQWPDWRTVGQDKPIEHVKPGMTEWTQAGESHNHGTIPPEGEHRQMRPAKSNCRLCEGRGVLTVPSDDTGEHWCHRSCKCVEEAE